MGVLCCGTGPNTQIRKSALIKSNTGITVGYWKCRGMGAAIRMQL